MACCRLRHGCRRATGCTPTVERIRLAKALQADGSTLDEVIDVLHSFETGTTCADERWRLERVVDRIDRQFDELRALRHTVLDAMAACDDGRCQLTLPPIRGQP